MRREEFETAEWAQSIAPKIILNDLEDTSPRTLIYGYMLNRVTFHVYVKDGQIHRFLYTVEREGANIWNVKPVGHVVQDEWAPGALVPNKRTYPQYTDFNFAMLMAIKGAPLLFTRWSEPEDRGVYAGEVA